MLQVTTFNLQLTTDHIQVLLQWEACLKAESTHRGPIHSHIIGKTGQEGI